MTSTQKGNKGLALAIGYFGSHGYTVSVPLTDTQDYDLIVDNGILQKVQVKYTDSTTQSGVYTVSLRVVSGSTRKVVKKCSDCAYDLLFVVCGNGAMYLIPKSQIVNERSINITKDADIYAVGM